MILACLPALCYVLNTNHINQKNLNIYDKSNTHPRLSYASSGNRIHSTNTDLDISQYIDEIPLWEDTPESVIKQVRHYGPDPPEEIFKKPIRPLGLWGRRNKAPDMTHIGMDRAVVIRNLKKKYKSIMYRNVRRAYKRYIKDATSLEEVLYWKYKLDSLPRDSCPVRFRRRCFITGRSRGVVGIFGICRHKVMELLEQGTIPGVSRASW